MGQKKFKLRADQIRDVAQGHGGCMASDRITVNGLKVGYMYREDPQKGLSGWIFLSGDETQEYLDNPANADIYNVNTIANYDPEIIPLLGRPVGSAFARKDQNSKLLSVEGPPIPPDEVRQLTKEWSIDLSPSFKARIEERSLVFAAPARTVFISVWNPQKGRTAEVLLKELKQIAHPQPVERYEPAHATLRRFGYLLMESDDQKGARWALYAFTISPTVGHLQLAFYFDFREDLAWARQAWDSIIFTPQA